MSERCEICAAQPAHWFIVDGAAFVACARCGTNVAHNMGVAVRRDLERLKAIHSAEREANAEPHTTICEMAAQLKAAENSEREAWQEREAAEAVREQVRAKLKAAEAERDTLKKQLDEAIARREETVAMLEQVRQRGQALAEEVDEARSYMLEARYVTAERRLGEALKAFRGTP